jgi:AsmA-like C-terminal region
MSERKKYLVIGLVVSALLGFVLMLIVASRLAKRFEPYIREQAILYLRRRFDSEVELTALRVRMPQTSPLRLLLNRGRGAVARVEGEGLLLRHKGRRDVPPMFAMKEFSFEVDLGTLFESSKIVRLVTLDGMEINIPPKGQRPTLGSSDRADVNTDAQDSSSRTGVIIEKVLVRNSNLTILPKEQNKVPLRWGLHRVQLASVGVGVAMKYEAELTNAKPPGEIVSRGNFGPWVAGEPGDTPLDGAYTFDNADLGVFDGIAGILHSDGKFEGQLDSIAVQGQATVPDFRLKISGNRVPLSTRFDVLVDGTNGNTVLRPVFGTLGRTSFTTSGGIIKHEGDAARGISLTVSMPKGDLQDLLRLAMKGPSFMEGVISLRTKIDIPPLSAKKIKEKLLLDGNFELSQGKFLRSSIQDKIDTLSRRGQGQPKNEEIDEVVHRMKGVFQLNNEVMTFKSLSFAVPGAAVDLAGNYNLRADVLDFHGALRLQANVSQTMTGWKRWALKPVDPFFSKNGAGTFLRIKVDGTADDPNFGLDHGKKDQKKENVN